MWAEVEESGFSRGYGLVKAEGVLGGVGILELEEAVGGGGAEADIEPVGEVGAGLDFVGLAGGAGELEEDRAGGLCSRVADSERGANNTSPNEITAWEDTPFHYHVKYSGQ